MAGQIRTHVRDRGNRQSYVACAMEYLASKRPDLARRYDVVLVGAGLHAAVFLHTLRRSSPGLKALIVEQSNTICSTFSRLGDSLILNSPTFPRVGIDSNILPGHFVQTGDFDELADRPFPTAKHLYELATMALFHADADIAFDFRVDEVRKAGGHYSVSARGTTVDSRSIVISNGMGTPRSSAFRRDQSSSKVLHGDDFIRACREDRRFLQALKDKTIAVVGSGDTANCAMEYLLPLTYPPYHHSARRNPSFAPAFVYWIGQGARNVQDYYFANKQRYCHSGGVVEFFWDGEAPFEIPAREWRRARALIRHVPADLSSLSHTQDSLRLTAGSEQLDVDMVVDCTGRFNELSAALLRDAYEFVEGDVAFHGGQWDANQERFVTSPRHLEARRIACRLRDEAIFLVGCACPLGELIDDDEAMDGSLKHQESRTSITNSKFSLEHTLPRSAALAEQYAEVMERVQAEVIQPTG